MLNHEIAELYADGTWRVTHRGIKSHAAGWAIINEMKTRNARGRMQTPVTPKQLAAFRATRKFCPDLRTVEDLFEDCDSPVPGFLYCGESAYPPGYWIAIEPDGTFSAGTITDGLGYCRDLGDVEFLVAGWVISESGDL